MFNSKLKQQIKDLTVEVKLEKLFSNRTKQQKLDIMKQITKIDNQYTIVEKVQDNGIQLILMKKLYTILPIHNTTIAYQLNIGQIDEREK